MFSCVEEGWNILIENGVIFIEVKGIYNKLLVIDNYIFIEGFFNWLFVNCYKEYFCYECFIVVLFV